MDISACIILLSFEKLDIACDYEFRVDISWPMYAHTNEQLILLQAFQAIQLHLLE